MTESGCPSPQNRIAVLQMLRGIAALIVVMFHAMIYVAPSDNNATVHWLLASGPSGVDLFFCISGFVMVYNTNSVRNRSVIDFCIKRISRIFPIYAVLTILFSFILRIILYIINFDDPSYHLGPEHIVRSLLFIPFRLSSAAEAPIWGAASLQVGWTLNYEMYFYAVFAVSMWFGRARWVAFFTWIGFTLVALPWLVKGYVVLDAYSFYDWRLPYLNLMTSPLIWEFVAGVVICFLYLSPLRFPSRPAAWVSVTVVVAFAAWLLLNGTRRGFGVPRWGYIYIILLTVLVIADKSIDFKIPAPLLWLGNVSFSLYLVHPIVVQSVGLGLLQFDGLHPMLTGMPYVAFLTSLSLLAAMVAHRWLEVALSNGVRIRAERLVLRMRLSMSNAGPVPTRDSLAGRPQPGLGGSLDASHGTRMRGPDHE